MIDNRARVLLILPQDVFDEARALAGRATATFKLPVSAQIVLRALIEEGLKRGDDRKLLANIEGQAQAIRRIRSLAGRDGRDGNAMVARMNPGAREAPGVRRRRPE